jgi:hypothetical protein
VHTLGTASKGTVMDMGSWQARRLAYDRYARLFWALVALPAGDPAAAKLRRVVARAEAHWRTLYAKAAAAAATNATTRP